jgi:hypothetical protein
VLAIQYPVPVLYTLHSHVATWCENVVMYVVPRTTVTHHVRVQAPSWSVGLFLSSCVVLALYGT